MNCFYYQLSKALSFPTRRVPVVLHVFRMPIKFLLITYQGAAKRNFFRQFLQSLPCDKLLIYLELQRDRLHCTIYDRPLSAIRLIYINNH